ncbi:hotdog fold thioesterase [Lutimonas sp.]|uniref:hotdog fold thioesterase n=1 Tax=Lutimonas sp. TaxID=1872403 RepID=UPI003C7283AE
MNAINKGTLMETLDITYTEIGDDFLVATMPVNSRVHQPMGLLHGGASVALAESVGSAASYYFLDHEKQEVRGLEINANHVRSVREGLVKATARILHKGRTTVLWEIKIEDEKHRLVSICKLTCIILTKQ